ncbi:MAG TPA: ABC-F family ATP-binding cassette domain-containing protein [Acidimicrobiales bacterium]|nr:ABC-F family ATP-binding cassette domain-containing protein [Acidimicrobiales bacterium]
MFTVTKLELRVGPRLLLEPTSFHVAAGDRIGLVGRNGSGKTTLLRTLAGETVPESGDVIRSGAIGYLPQDHRTGDLDVPARQRILSARGLDHLSGEMEAARAAMGGPDPVQTERVLRHYGALEDRFEVLGGYGAAAEADAMASGLALPERVLDQPLRTLSGGQRRRIELARVLFSGAEMLLLDEPTNHLDADSIAWLRDFLRAHNGGLVVISHDGDLLESTVNRVFHLDANRASLEVYNLGWRAYLEQREVDERRRRRERANAEKRAAALRDQAARMRAKATKARAAKGMDRRAEQLMAGVGEVRRADRVARLRFPSPAPCGRTPLSASGLSKSFGSLEVFTDVDLAVDRSSRVVVLGLNGAGKTTLLRVLAGLEVPDTGTVTPGHGLRMGYYAQEHEQLDDDVSVLENLRSTAAHIEVAEARNVLGSFLFSGDAVDQQVGTLSGGEKTRLALAALVVSGANVLLLDEPTNNLDPASRAEVLVALARYEGAVVLVTHDEEAVESLRPERVLLLPDGVEDAWRGELADLVALS